MKIPISVLTVLLVLGLWTAAQAQAKPESKDRGKSAQAQLSKGPKIEKLGQTDADIVWSSATADTTLKYGTDKNNLDKSADVHSSGHTQRVFLRDLKPSTTYYYRVEANGKPISAIESFQTKGMSASAAAPSSAATNANFQVVAGPVAEKITNNSAEVWYAVDKPTDTLVRYGVDPNVMAMHAPPEKLAGERSYKATLTNLRPNTTYYVAVAHPNGTIVERANFKTEPANFNEQAQKVRITNGPVFEQVASDNAIIAWSTNIAASTTVHYGTDVNIIGHTAQGAAGTNHRVLIKGLQPNTRYFFRVESTSAQGPAAVARSEPFHFKTEAPGQAVLSMPQLH